MSFKQYIKTKLQAFQEYLKKQEELLLGDKPLIEVELNINCGEDEEDETVEEIVSTIQKIEPERVLSHPEIIERWIRDMADTEDIIIIPKQWYNECDALLKTRIDNMFEHKRVIFFEEDTLFNVASLSTGFIGRFVYG